MTAGPRPLVARARRRRRRRLPARADGLRGSALPHVHERHDREAEGDRPHDRPATSSASRRPTTTSSTSSPRPTSTGAPPTSAGSPATATSSTGRSATARPRSSTRGRRTSPTRTAGGRSSSATGSTILYTAPTAIRTHMKWGPEYAAAARPLEPAPARLGRRADQPRGLDLVPRARRRRPLPDRRHLVADRDRDDPDHAAARGDDDQARLGDAAVPGRRGGDLQRGAARRSGPGGGGYLVLKQPWPAMLRGIFGDDARYRETYWSKYGDVYFAGDGARIDHGRRLLAARPGRRRDERLRPPHLDDRGRVARSSTTTRSPRPPSRPAPTR